MVDQRGFGKRQGDDMHEAVTKYRREMTAIGKSLPLKSWIIGAIGLYVGISILVHSNNAGTKAPSAAAAQIVQPAVAEKPKCGATLQEYNAVSVGMAQRQVASIIGCPGTEMTRVSYGGQESVMLSWPGTGFLSSMDATFGNDRLVTKGQLGLE